MGYIDNEGKIMKLKVLKCPECRANIEIEDGRNFCFCNYCGCKIILDDEKQETTINKNVNINKNTTHTQRYINDAEVIKAESEAKESKRGIWIGILVPVICFLIFFGYFGVQKHASNVEEEKLQTIVEQVMVDIENEDFDEAYIKANSIRYTSGWSSDIEKKWDKMREALLDQIKKAEKKATGKTSFWDWFN